MRGRTHAAAGVCAGICVASHAGLPLGTGILVIASSAIGSLLPDLDTFTSTLGRRTAPVSFLIRLVFGHRTILHAVIPWTLLAVLLCGIYPDVTTYVSAAAVGVATHLLLDMLNPAGVPLLWPLGIRFRLGIFRSGGLCDRLLGIGLSVAAIIFAYHYVLAQTPIIFAGA